MKKTNTASKKLDKSKSIKESDFKYWETINKDDFPNQMIDRKSDFVKLKEFHIPSFLENEKLSSLKKGEKNILKIFETSESSSNE